MSYGTPSLTDFLLYAMICNDRNSNTSVTAGNDLVNGGSKNGTKAEKCFTVQQREPQRLCGGASYQLYAGAAERIETWRNISI